MLVRPLLFRAARTLVGCRAGSPSARCRRRLSAGFTLVEMLVALAITLLLMAAVVTVFANVTGSVTRRRATLEMAGQLRTVREQLSRDLEGATCPALPWREPEANEGYIEIIEGPQTDIYPSIWLYNSLTTTDTINGVSVTVADTDATTGRHTQTVGTTPGIDLTISSLPGSNLRDESTPRDQEGRGRMIGSYAALPEDVPTDGRGLGDADDTLMLTVRNEQQPFVGRIPPRPALTGAFGPANSLYAAWGTEEYESPLAEVIWFALENPPEREDSETFAFGEPGYRTIYRRALLIAPQLNYQIPVGSGSAAPRTGPGVVRVLPASVDQSEVGLALASLVSFQERYDLSVRLEWDVRYTRWTLIANTLGDLTKRENRYEHHGGYFIGGNEVARAYPYAAISRGSYAGPADIRFFHDPELTYAANVSSPAFRTVVTQGFTGNEQQVVWVEPDDGNPPDALLDPANSRPLRPFAYVRSTPSEARPATPRAILNEDGATVAITLGLAPLSGSRRGDDVMMTDALSFDLKVYDPGAPVYAYYQGGIDSTLLNQQPADRIVTPGDPAWAYCYTADAFNAEWQENSSPTIGTLNTGGIGNPDVASPGLPDRVDGDMPFSFVRLGAYVDLNFGRSYADFADDENPPGVSDHHDPFGLDPQFQSHEVVGRTIAPYHTQLGVTDSWFMGGGQIQSWRPAVSGSQPYTLRNLTLGYSMYDTWSWHYERNGLNEDQDLTSGQPFAPGSLPPSTAALPHAIDEGVDTFDSPSIYGGNIDTGLGADDPGERETRPPYDRPLRGIQAQLRVYERDSRQVRETTVRESFVPE